MNQEEYLAEEFGLLGVKPHITHLKQLEWGYYSFVTIATPRYEEYALLDAALINIYQEGSVLRKNGSALDAFLAEEFGLLGFGVAPCHAVDNFSRKRGRIMAKGRLLKLLRKERAQCI